MPPGDASNIECAIEDIGQQTQVTKILVYGAFNTNISDPEGHPCGKAIFETMAMEGLEDMLAHFLPHHLPWTRDGRMWIMIRCGQEGSPRRTTSLGNTIVCSKMFLYGTPDTTRIINRY